MNGEQAETYAAEWLKKHGFKLLYKNYRSRWGEIDLIGTQQNTLCFVEVRYRTRQHYGSPEETVTRQKQKKIIRTAQYFLMQHQQLENFQSRFDVVSIIMKNNTPSVSWIKNAFLC